MTKIKRPDTAPARASSRAEPARQPPQAAPAQPPAAKGWQPKPRAGAPFVHTANSVIVTPSAEWKLPTGLGPPVPFYLRPLTPAEQFDGKRTLRPDQRQYLQAMRAGTAQHAPTIEAAAENDAAKSRPLTAKDRSDVRQAQATLAAARPRRIDSPTNPNLVQIEVAFDGTGNDASLTDWQTNPARLHDSFAGDAKTYVRGVMTRRDSDLGSRILEGGAGHGISHRVDQAYGIVVAQINEAKRKNPKAEVVLVVTGFSRGAATARQFVNALNERGVPILGDSSRPGGKPRNFEAPRIGAMVIYDTVDAHIEPGTPETIPTNVENVLHLTANDEHRLLFPLTTAVDARKPNSRITEIGLPGAHSDVGGGYANGYSDISRQMAYDYLVKAGVRMKAEAPGSRVSIDDPTLRLHNSGGQSKEFLTGRHLPRVVRHS